MLSVNRNSDFPRFLAALLVVFLLGACSSGPKRPVFYPNSHIKQVGQYQAQRDTDDCMALADSYNVDRTRDGEVGTKAASGALIGGAGAGAWGLVRGDGGERALAGAVAGGTVGAVKGGFESRRISPIFQKFVQQCLRDRGYQVIGWQ
jgi:uncharacterized membrane protein